MSFGFISYLPSQKREVFLWNFTTTIYDILHRKVPKNRNLKKHENSKK